MNRLFKINVLVAAMGFGVMLPLADASSVQPSLLAKAMAESSLAEHYFDRVAILPVYKNLAATQDINELTSAEIIAATADGMGLLYTDAYQHRVGLVDITDPKAPVAQGFVAINGEPTSVAVHGDHAFVVVDTSESFVSPSGHLLVLDVSDLAQPKVVRTLDMGGQPDSIAVSADGRYLAVAIENERDEAACPDGQGGLIAEAYDDEDACDAFGQMLGGLPQLPGGYVNIVEITGAPNTWQVRKVDMSGLADVAPTDAEPEFISINSANQAVLSMQENNYLAIIDLASGQVVNHFSAGAVDLDGIDIKKNKIIETEGSLESVKREPDAVGWVSANLFATANEGDYEGGSRGFTLFDQAGDVSFDAGNEFEHLAMRYGHFPESRAGKKGSEPEGVAVGHYDVGDMLFVGSERGNFVAVYKMENDQPVFQQMLPTAIGPEGLVAIPSRNLFVATSEVDTPDLGPRAVISIFELHAKPPVRIPAEFPEITWDYIQAVGGVDKLIKKLVEISQTWTEIKVNPEYPQIMAQDVIGWGALSGLVADKADNNLLYAVSDSAYAQSHIYTVNVEGKPALITKDVVLHKGGEPVGYDLEGIALHPAGGFWAVSEGKPDVSENLLLHVDTTGEVLREVRLPEAVSANQVKYGFEGVAVDAGKVYVAFQREWQDDPDRLVKIGCFNPANDSWSFYYYPLDAAPEGAWVGLSELVSMGSGKFQVIERDNQQGELAQVKRIYSFDLAVAVDEGEQYPVLIKQLVRDVLPDMQAGHGWVPDKLEGMAVAQDGTTYLVTDNDALSDAVGETQFLRIESGN